MKSSTSIFFVILTFHPSLDLLKKNLQILDGYPVVVVDNTPEQEEKDLIFKKVGNQAHLISNEKNLGYTGGMNVGLNYAFKEGATWVVLLNDDITLTPSSLETLVQHLENQKPGIVGPFPGYLDPNRWTTILPKYAKPGKSPDYLSGSCLAIHKDVNAVVQGFYKDFFLYYEDVDYCIQAKKAGFPLIDISLPGLDHQDGKSIEKGSPQHEYYLARNHLLFVERQAPFFIKLREVFRLPKTLWDHHFFMNKAAERGVIDFLFLRYGQGPRL